MSFALIDANSFYCSCEAVFNPFYRGKPLVVLSNNDGTVVAANRLAKQCGVEKFQPYFKIKALCEARGVIVRSSNYELYADISTKMMNVISRFAPRQYIYSIDESFLDLHNCSKSIKDIRQHGALIKKTVWRECRIPVSVGIGPTLTLAKSANHAAKDIAGYQGVCVIDNDQERIAVLRTQQVSDVWGIGSRYAQRLKHMGIETAYDLSRFEPSKARRYFNVEMERTVRELNGEICKIWDDVRADKQQIYSTRSVGERITDLNSLQEALAKRVGIAAKKARAQNSLCKTMICFAHTSSFDQKTDGFKVLHKIPYPTSDTMALVKLATDSARQFYKPGVPYYKIGVGLIELVDGLHEQLDLLNPRQADDELMKVLDGINRKYGNDTMFLAAQGIEPKWEMRRELLSPQYTTKWNDIPKVRC